MADHVHQRLYGPFRPGTILNIIADPDLAEISYRGNMSKHPGNEQTSWGDNDLESGVSEVLDGTENRFITITIICLTQSDFQVTFTFNDHGSVTEEVVSVSPVSDNETHLLSADILFQE